MAIITENVQSKNKPHITIAGAGLVGSLVATYLAKRGYKITVFEKREDMRSSEISAGRSINLALANRGIFPLDEVGLMDQVEKMLIPMAGRMIHDEAGELNFQSYGQKEHEVIYSVSRGELNKLLMETAEQTGNISLNFEHSIDTVDFENRIITLINHKNNDEVIEHHFDILIGADGTGSVVRKQMYQAIETDLDITHTFNKIEKLGHSYKELCIPAGDNNQFQIEKKALHIWPRGTYMLIALPNLDGSFTVTLFLPNEGNNSFATLTDREAVETFFAEQFPDALALIPNLVDEFFENPTGHLGTVRCSNWHYANNTLLIGDAAHGVVPFHGQGMNCGFEDASELNRLLSENNDDWNKVFGPYQDARCINGNAIADMAIENYIEMRDSVRDDKYLLKKDISFELEKRFPNQFIPRYSMVMFHRMPYDTAKSRGVIQSRILNQLSRNVDNIEAVDYGMAEDLIKAELPPLT